MTTPTKPLPIPAFSPGQAVWYITGILPTHMNICGAIVSSVLVSSVGTRYTLSNEYTVDQSDLHSTFKHAQLAMLGYQG